MNSIISVSTETKNATPVFPTTLTKSFSRETLSHVSCCISPVYLPSEKCSRLELFQNSRDVIQQNSGIIGYNQSSSTSTSEKHLFSPSTTSEKYFNNDRQTRTCKSQEWKLNDCDRNMVSLSAGNEEMMFKSSASTGLDVGEKECLLQYKEDNVCKVSKCSGNDGEVKSDRIYGDTSPSKKRSLSSINAALISHVCSVSVNRPLVCNGGKEECLRTSDCSVFLPPQSYSSLLLYRNFDYTSVKVYAGRLIISCLVFMLSVFIQGFCSVVSDQFYKTGEPRLKDRIHDALGGRRPEWLTVDIVNGFCCILTISSIIRFAILVPWQISCVIWTRFFYCTALLYTLRGIAIVVTTLPSPVESCIPLNADGIGEILKSVILMSFGQVYECTDMIVSGHTLFMTSMLMLWVFYSYKTTIALCVVFLYWLWLLIIINISFFHYTVDIIIAAVFAVSIWSIYHMIIDIGAAHCLLKRQKNESLRNISVNNISSYGVISMDATTPICLCMEQERFITRCLIGRSLMQFVIFIEALNYRVRNYLLQKKQRESASAFEVDGTTLERIEEKKGEFALFSVEDGGEGTKGKCIEKKFYTYQSKMKKRFSSDEMRLFYESYAGNGKIFWGNIVLFTKKCFKCCYNKPINSTSSNTVL